MPRLRHVGLALALFLLLASDLLACTNSMRRREDLVEKFGPPTQPEARVPPAAALEPDPSTPRARWELAIATGFLLGRRMAPRADSAATRSLIRTSRLLSTFSIREDRPWFDRPSSRSLFSSWSLHPPRRAGTRWSRRRTRRIPGP